jgi:hypothetical protein
MPDIPNWLVGRHVTACTLTPQTNTAGTLADTTPVATMFGHVDEIDIDGTKTTENIKPMNTIRRNMVTIDVGTQMTVTEILKSSGTNLLPQAWNGSPEYFKLLVTRGAQGHTFYALMTSCREQLRHGKSVAVATFEMVDTGSANPAYA